MRVFFTLMLSWLMLSCTAIPTEYHQLANTAYRYPDMRAKSIDVAIQLADHLHTNALIYQTAPGTLHFASHNIWAERLDTALNKSISNYLNQMDPQRHYLPYKTGKNDILSIYIERFYGSFDGLTHIEGYALWTHPNGKVFKTVNFNIETHIEGEGYPAMVHALSQGLKQMAQSILSQNRM